MIGGLLASASLILFANVVARYVFNWGVPWAEELVRYEIIWMVFIGGSVAVRKGIHIGIDILATVSPPKTQTVIHLVINA
ncbi:MAG: C4-dicarboxylate transporter DctQ subunit, partial [Flavobacteriaceae bacterium]